MGIGLHGGGIGTIKFLAKEGAVITATDLRDENKLAPALEALKGLPVRFILGRHDKDDFIEADLIVKNPGVPVNSPWLVLARAHGIKITSDIGLFVERNLAFTVGITSTKGKSTTASLIAHILKTAGVATLLAGNIRISVLEILPQIKKKDVVVLELSSWQLEDLEGHNWSPQVAAFLNLLPDHLNRYGSMEEYGESKKLIFKFQTKKDFLVANFDDRYVKTASRNSKSRIKFFSTAGDSSETPLAVFINDGRIFSDFFGQTALMNVEDIPLKGRHNTQNVVAAVAAIGAILKHPDSPIKDIHADIVREAIISFRPPQGRLEELAVLNGIRYINDTSSTTPDATYAAINSYPKDRIILIAGGENKNLSYAFLAEEIVKGIKFLILLEGSASNALLKELNNLSWNKFIKGINNLDIAVKEARARAEAGDIVLLSPGAASFNLFAHEFDRGDKFKNAVFSIKL